MIRHATKQSDLPMDRLFHFFQTQILTISAKLGLLGNMDALSVAGDGTPVVTAAYTRSKSTCDCRAQDLAKCNHPRIYSQPDCNSGWDSSREKYFNGYHLYMISAADSRHDLPLYPRLQPASRHDSVKWRCSLSRGTKNSCTSLCSKAKYGRTYHTHSKDNLRLFTKTPRDSEKWKVIYKRRTSIERSNKREKIDYKLESGRHRSTKMWYVRIYAIMICQHMDAWYFNQKENFNDLKPLIFSQTS